MKYISLIFILCFGHNAVLSQTSSPLSTSELVINSTIRIECIGDTIIGGKKIEFTSIGTGFYFQYKFGELNFQVIVTNYHVIKNSKKGILRFTETNVDNSPAYGKIITEEVNNFGSRWIKHPSADLAICPLAPILSEVSATQKKDPFIVYYDESLLPSKQLLDEVTSIEEVLMIGYPRGFWDASNNLPMVRKGLTATPISIDYNQKPEFLIDIPIYEGSSGSPIILFNQGSYSTKKGNVVIGGRISLLGINYQSVNYSAEGELVLNPKIQTATKIPINIAVIIKSQELIKFRPIIEKLLNQKK